MLCFLGGMASRESGTVQSRSCGGCTLCCKVYEVPVLTKPKGKWCAHCSPGKGCAIHMTRPEFCRDFQCMWILDAKLGDEWRPDRAKFAMSYHAEKSMLAVTVDSGAPHAWKREPYYAKLKAWARDLLAKGHFVVVYNGDHATLVTTEHDQPLGPVGRGFTIDIVPDGATTHLNIRRGKPEQAA